MIKMSELDKIIEDLSGVESLLNSISFKDILTGNRLSKEKVEKIKSETDKYIHKVGEILEL